MPVARPQSYLALALATLAVMLAAWWAWDTFGSLDPQPDTAGGNSTFLPPLDFPDPPPDEPAPTLAPAEKPVVVADEGKPPLNPPEIKPPEMVQPLASDPEPAPADGNDEFHDEDDEPRGPDDMRAPSRPSSLIGGVARVNERASQEVRVGGAPTWIGTPEHWVANLQQQRSKVPYVGLLMEAPRHRREVEDFFLDRFETPNHRYWEFLQDTASVLYRTSDHEPRTLIQVTEYLIQDPPSNLDLAAVTGRQLFLANNAVLLQAFKSIVVTRADGTVDLEATYERIKDRVLPNGIDLTFYTRAPPGTWPADRYLEREVDHPVRDVSVEDAIAFAVWRGRFVPSEIQWEYAARGRKGLDWPWGNDGATFDERVNGGQARATDERPRTQSVFQFASGASWVGTFQMAGNVSEWTSSFLETYPGGVRSVPGSPERHVVVRGGSAFDQERYLLRPAFRGWLETDPDGAPTSNQRRAWTGIRTARYGTTSRLNAVRGRIPTMHFRARKGRRLDPTCLQEADYGGWQGLHVERFRHVAGESDEIARAKTRPGVKTLVVNPFQTVSLLDRGRWRPNADATITNVAQLLAKPGPILLAVLHTDVHLRDTWHSATEPFNTFSVPARLRREDVPPGTYFLASIEGVLSLLKPDRTDVWYLSNRPATESTLSMIEQKYRPGVRNPRTLRFRRRGADRVDLDLLIPVHQTADPGYALRLVLRLRPDEVQTRTLTNIDTFVTDR